MHDQSGGQSPVFVDRTGRRRRLTVIAGTAMGLGLLTSLALILAGLFHDSSVSVPGWSDDRAPIEAELDGRDGLGGVSATPDPTSATSTTAPLSTATHNSTPTTPATSPSHAARPTPSDEPPGQGLGNGPRPSGKPSKSPGKPG